MSGGMINDDRVMGFQSAAHRRSTTSVKKPSLSKTHLVRPGPSSPNEFEGSGKGCWITDRIEVSMRNHTDPLGIEDRQP